MSGGVDSSVAAYLMREAGYDVTGITMRLYDNETIGQKGCRTCCSLSDIEDACSVANRLGISYAVCDFRSEFKHYVIDRFISDYERGVTPNPCIECNRYLKFEALYNYGRSLDHDIIATGHYARIEKDPGSGRYLLRKSVDLSKDQSYVLYSLTQDQLSHTVFPLGGLTKHETRKIAEEQGFVNAHKSESQDICFVPDGDYASFITRYTGKTFPPGDFVDSEGNVLGRHRGIIHYTIGQRKGLGLALKEPAYVKKIDAENNRVVLGRSDEIFSRELTAADFNWIACDAPTSAIRASARIRYRHHEAPAVIEPLSEDRVRITFDEPQRAVTAGQSVVVYDGDYVVGGGTIL